MGIKQELRCKLCDDEEPQTLRHLYIDCKCVKSLIANFEKQYKIATPLTELEKLIGVDPNQQRKKLILKKLNILRRMIYQSNHADEKPRWGKYLELIDRVYTYEYAIADEGGKVLQHPKIWKK